ncbi:probable class I alpha-mannosidase [Phialocephala subalpina]|uniref:alpha-1,2-Mannosidase n=1 Tax=Phialocephala subalpina TaxID=576137 RepID=A0A1L7XHH9_9HELO|nr:probable class I alpha-mannosidase [Phialocephala subalpina]
MFTRWRGSILSAVIIITFLLYIRSPFSFQETSQYASPSKRPPPLSDNGNAKFKWKDVPQRFPVSSVKPVPTIAASTIPRIQHVFKETSDEKRVRLSRLQQVKGNFTHAWKGYKEHAWLRDEVKPISGGSEDPFGGWAASMVDSLDTLLIMGMHDEFREALDAINQIDFSTCALEELNVFETTIRYLGGFLSAYDLTKGKYPILLQKAIELGDMLYKAFDTPNRLPIVRWNFKDAATGKAQEANDNVLVSEPGSLSLEFTRLSQVSGDAKYYDAVQRIMDTFDQQQDMTKLPGMWPVIIDQKHADFKSYYGFTIGGMADSLYEYLPKQHMLLGGATQQYRRMYEYAIIAIKRNIFYRPMTLNGEDVRLAGNVDSDGSTHVSVLKTDSQAQHLGCFAGGMVAIGAKIFENDEDLALGRKLVEGCLWAYEVMPTGIMPEIMHAVACEDKNHCPWDEKKWHDKVNELNEGEEDVKTKIENHRLRPGVAKVDDGRYILRPEAIESVFILYRITGDENLRERAWNMFTNTITHCLTDIGHAGIEDVTSSSPPKQDRMESFWMAETLKYFYLIFAEPDVVSLDEYVLNTEAHPLKRPT